MVHSQLACAWRIALRRRARLPGLDRSTAGAALADGVSGEELLEPTGDGVRSRPESLNAQKSQVEDFRHGRAAWAARPAPRMSSANQFRQHYRAGHASVLPHDRRHGRTGSQPGEVARLTNAAARMMDAYQNGCLVHQKLKTSGRLGAFSGATQIAVTKP